MTVPAFSIETLSGALSALESREYGLLAWGITSALLTLDEVEETLLDFVEDNELDCQIGELREELVNRRVLFPVPESSGYRTRMAETVRTLATLRQTYRSEQWWQGRPLVLDYRFSTNRRSRPRFDRPIESVSELVDSQTRKDALLAVSPALLSGFQERGVRAILAAIDRERTSGVVVTAGTGSGKTNAFYLPALSWIAESIESDSSHWLRALTLYPRKELLRDQLSTCLDLTLRLDSNLKSRRSISLGAWYGATPKSPRAVLDGWADTWTLADEGGTGGGWNCPYLDCPVCGAPLTWRRTDVEASVERLHCSSQSCETVLNESQLRLTRQSICANPPDILFTTTESLNRQLADSSSWRAFGLRTKAAPRLVLLDEIHTYEGITGAQNAHLLRRYRHAVFGPLVMVGLSATLRNADSFMADLVGLRDEQVVRVAPDPQELHRIGAEYLLALRHDSTHMTSPLSTTIQTVMALARSLDRRGDPVSAGLFGERLFVFGDRHDTINRLLWDILDAEGWYGRAGNLRRGSPPLTLAHLRSREQTRRPMAQREDSSDRLANGQWWWHSEIIGHDIQADQQLAISRTTSKDPGVSARSDVIVATATLEVGYDDDGVGAVIQHKAPHDAARFLQRKGRAGRDALMRPWMAVVLADFGRDRLIWQLFEQLTDPELEVQHLPIGNRYVRRVQGVYAFLDWLAIELSREKGVRRRSAWTLLSSPGKDVESRRAQERAAEIISQVMSGGPAADRLSKHLVRALAIQESDLNSLLWSPPRSLMLAVLPTAYRRLATGWREEEIAGGNYGGSPLPEFATSSQFGDLLTPEVIVSIPTAKGSEMTETTSVLSVLIEYMPGNLSRRHSVHSPQERHWVEPPADLSGVVDLSIAYNAERVRILDVPDAEGVEQYTLYRPRAFALGIPPIRLSDSTVVRPDWRSLIQPIGDGVELELPQSHWSNVVVGVRSHLHQAGGGVTVDRMAVGGRGRTFVNNKAQSIEIEFAVPSDDDDAFEAPPPPALGVEFEADAIVFDLAFPAELPDPSPLERTDRFEWVFQQHDALAMVSVFDREVLTNAALLIMARRDSTISPEASVKGIVGELLVEAIGDLSPVSGQSAQSGGHNKNSRRVEVEALAATPEIHEAVAYAVNVLTANRDSEWLRWTKKRLASTIGAVAVDAMGRICPGVDVDDLVVDVTRIDGSIRVWISEATPGGNGYLEQVHQAVSRDPLRFTRMLDKATEPGDVELLDVEIRALLADIFGSERIAIQAESLLQAWPLGHEAVERAYLELRTMLLSRNPLTASLAITTVVNRVLGPGAHENLAVRCAAIADDWDALEDECGFAVDPQIFAAIEAEANPDLESVLQLRDDSSIGERARAIQNVMWPRGRLASRTGIQLSSRFGQVEGVDVELLRTLVPRDIPTLEIEDLNDGVVADAQELLARGQLDLVSRSEHESLLHGLGIRLQAEPIALGVLHAYPVVVGVSRDHDRTRVSLVLPEALR